MVAIENVGLSELSYIYNIGQHTAGFMGLEGWGKLMDTCLVVLVISCLAFVTFTLAIVIIMCSLQEFVWAVITRIPFCIFRLLFHLGQDDAWEQPE